MKKIGPCLCQLQFPNCRLGLRQLDVTPSQLLSLDILGRSLDHPASLDAKELYRVPTPDNSTDIATLHVWLARPNIRALTPARLFVTSKLYKLLLHTSARTLVVWC